MYPNNSFLEKRTSPSPSPPTFLNIHSTGAFNYPTNNTIERSLNHQNQHLLQPSMKFAKTKNNFVSSSTDKSIDQTELIYPDDGYSIEFCMPNDVICKCPPGSSSSSLSASGNSYRDHTSRRKYKNKPEISNRWTRKTPSTASEHSTCSSTTAQEIINLDNYCAQSNKLQPPVYDVYSYAYLEPPPPAPENHLQQQQQHQQQQQQQQQQQPLHHHHYHHHHHHTLHNLNKQQHQQASTTPSTTSTTSSSSSTSFMPIYGSGPSTSSGGSTSSSKSPSRNSIKALLAKSFRSRAIISNNANHPTNTSRSISASATTNSTATAAAVAAAVAATSEKYTFTTRYGTTENLYEEVNEEKIREILSNEQTLLNQSQILTQTQPQPQPLAILPQNSKEEQRRVQSNHFRILDELNLSLEALIMPPTPPDISPTSMSPEHLLNGGGGGGSKSVENLSSAFNSIDLKENYKERFNRRNCKTITQQKQIDDHHHFPIGDLDSGFSVSGSGSSCCNDSFKSNHRFGEKLFNSSTMSSKKQHQHQQHNHGQMKGLNNIHDSIAMTLISPSSPFKSMRRYFDTTTTATATTTTTTIPQPQLATKLNSTPKLSSPSDESNLIVRNKNTKFWTIRQ